MAFDFPNAPTDGEIYSPVGGPTYVYRTASGAWEIQTGGTNSAFVAKSGDTMTGNLSIVNAGLVLNDTSGTAGKTILGESKGVPRWYLELGNGSSETGSNVGNDFVVYNASDSGGYLGTPFSINRATGNANFSQNLTVGGTLYVAGNIWAESGLIYLNNSGSYYIQLQGNTVAMPTCNMSAGGTITAASTIQGSAVTASAAGQCFTSGNLTLYQDGSSFQLWYNSSPCSWTYEKDDGLQNWNVNGAVIMQLQYGPNNFVVYGGGYKPGGGTWTDTSDARIKTVEEDYVTGLDAIVRLRPVVYTFKGNDTPKPPTHFVPPDETPDGRAVREELPLTAPYPNSPHYQEAVSQKRFHGLIAQEVEAIFPETVTKNDSYIDGAAVTDLRHLDTGPLIFALVNAVKELKALIASPTPMPSCAVTASTTQAVVKNTPTKIKFDAVEFDVTSGFDVVSNRYLPQVAGYYMVNCGCGLLAGTVETYTSIYKNGAEYRRSTTGDSSNARLSTLVYLDGATDYVEGFVLSKSNFSTDTSTVLTSFSASLTQAAS